MEHTRLEILLHKQLTHQISEEETAELNVLLSQEDNANIASDTTKIWDASAQYTPSLSFNTESNFQKLLDQINLEEGIQLSDTTEKPREAKVFNLFSFRNLSRVAAILVLGVLSFISYNNLSYNTISGGLEGQYVALEDGSSLWISPESSVKFKSSFSDERNLKLIGKAFFDVKRDESSPFTVNTDGVDVTVLGTSFMVDAKNNEVAVSSGKVKVEKGVENVTISKDQKVVVQDGSLMTQSASDEDFNWVVPVLKFDNTPLNQVLKELSLYYKVELKYKGRKDLSNCRYTATNLEGVSLDNVITLLQAAFQMEVERSEESNLITFSKIRCR